MDQIRLRVAACILDGDRILLAQHLKAGRRYWLLPGGGVDVGESVAVAARRELHEETGLDVEIGRLLLVCEAIGHDGAGFRHIVQLVHAGRVVGGELRPGCDGRLVEVAWRPVVDLPDLPFFPPIARDVAELCAERLEGPVRFLGNVFV